MAVIDQAAAWEILDRYVRIPVGYCDKATGNK